MDSAALNPHGAMRVDSIRLFGWRFIAPEAQGFQFFIADIQLRQLWLSGFDRTAPFEVGWRSFLVLATVSTSSSVNGCSAVCGHGVVSENCDGADVALFAAQPRWGHVRAHAVLSPSLPESHKFENE